MISIIIQSSALYWAMSLDLLLLLVVLYGRYEKQNLAVQFGQIMGSALLLVVSLLLAFVFRFIPAEWLLGFLGFIPLALGIKLLFVGEDDDEAELEKRLEKRKNKSIFMTALFVAFSSCGADNIALYTSYFAPMKLGHTVIATLTFLVNIVVLGEISRYIVRLPHLSDKLEKYNRWLVPVIYIGIGIMILIESGTLSHLTTFI
ncbi:cadmium resistance transporter [Lactococcus nasutitermitis]|uniref:Cadmium resistance transporter n=1 Tax=Lactococcus nasutitermitis TaxID=1652957 RepID=A0ABV9JC39_9LACT|nr:cadmium resistance transporter [Lactococcus nasutitermitis]